MNDKIRKRCPRCGVEKPTSSFYRSARYKDGLNSCCKECGAAATQRWAMANPEKVSARGRRFYANHREDFAEWNREYAAKPTSREARRAREATPEYQEVRREWARGYKRQRHRDDPRVRLASNLRRRVLLVLRGQSKSARTLELLGCTVDALRTHLESQFKPGMSWENYGGKRRRDRWEVDHIRPLASFDLTDPEQQRRAFHHTNLQPLWGLENAAKSDNYEAPLLTAA
jgi:hypothetical protein